MRTIALLLGVVACSSGGRFAAPKDLAGGSPIGTSIDDVWWVTCDDAGHVAPYHGTRAIPSTLPCEPVSATPAGPGALWIAGSTALIRLDASGDEEDHTAEVHVDGAYRPVRVASNGEHAYAVVEDDPEGRLFAFDGAAFAPVTPAGLAMVPVTVHPDGAMWAQATDLETCGATNDTTGWWCGGAPPSGGLLWDGTAWHGSSMAFAPEPDQSFAGLRPPSGSFPSDNVWYTGVLPVAETLMLKHWDGLTWRLVDVGPAPFVVERVVASPSGLVAVGATNVQTGEDINGSPVTSYDLASARWRGDGWGPARTFGHYSNLGPAIPVFAGELQDGTVIGTGGSDTTKFFPVAILP